MRIQYTKFIEEKHPAKANKFTDKAKKFFEDYILYRIITKGYPMAIVQVKKIAKYEGFAPKTGFRWLKLFQKMDLIEPGKNTNEWKLTEEFSSFLAGKKVLKSEDCEKKFGDMSGDMRVDWAYFFNSHVTDMSPLMSPICHRTPYSTNKVISKTKEVRNARIHALPPSLPFLKNCDKKIAVKKNKPEGAEYEELNRKHLMQALQNLENLTVEYGLEILEYIIHNKHLAKNKLEDQIVKMGGARAGEILMLATSLRKELDKKQANMTTVKCEQEDVEWTPDEVMLTKWGEKLMARIRKRVSNHECFEILEKYDLDFDVPTAFKKWIHWFIVKKGRRNHMDFSDHAIETSFREYWAYESEKVDKATGKTEKETRKHWHDEIVEVLKKYNHRFFYCNYEDLDDDERKRIFFAVDKFMKDPHITLIQLKEIIEHMCQVDTITNDCDGMVSNMFRKEYHLDGVYFYWGKGMGYSAMACINMQERMTFEPEEKYLKGWSAEGPFKFSEEAKASSG